VKNRKARKEGSTWTQDCFRFMFFVLLLVFVPFWNKIFRFYNWKILLFFFINLQPDSLVKFIFLSFILASSYNEKCFSIKNLEKSGRKIVLLLITEQMHAKKMKKLHLRDKRNSKIRMNINGYFSSSSLQK
jgi:hypothetical protein